jgi:hypothetical protein
VEARMSPPTPGHSLIKRSLLSTDRCLAGTFLMSSPVSWLAWIRYPVIEVDSS